MPAIFVIIYVAAIAGLAALTAAVKQSATLGFDTPIMYWIHGFTAPFLTTFAIIFTEAASIEGVAVITLAITAWLFYMHRRRAAAFMAVSLGGAAFIIWALKHLVDRARPELWTPLITETRSSFPSGHAMGSVALALSLGFLLWNTRWRWLTVALGGVYVLTVAWTRIYLGVHYPTDVLVGWIVSSLWVTAAYLVIKPTTPAKPEVQD